MAVENTINYGNWVVESFIAPGASFEEVVPFWRTGDEWTEIQFYLYDPDFVIIGQYGFKENGVIDYYAWETNPVASGAAEQRTSVFVDLYGNTEDFMNHAYSFNQFLQTPYGSNLLAQSLTYRNGQEMANVIDSLPGANPYDPMSSSFTPGGFAETFFA